MAEPEKNPKQDEIESLMRELGIQQGGQGAGAPAAPSQPAKRETSVHEVKKPQFDEFPAIAKPRAESNISLIRDVSLSIKVELGRTKLLVQDVLRLGAGSIVELDRLTGDPLDLYVNERLIARGEVLVINDN